MVDPHHFERSKFNHTDRIHTIRGPAPPATGHEGCHFPPGHQRCGLLSSSSLPPAPPALSTLAEEAYHQLTVLNTVVLENMALRTQANLQIVVPRVAGELSVQNLANITTCINYLMENNQELQTKLSGPTFEADLVQKTNLTKGLSLVNGANTDHTSSPLPKPPPMPVETPLRPKDSPPTTSEPPAPIAGGSPLSTWRRPTRKQSPSPGAHRAKRTLNRSARAARFVTESELLAHQKRLAALRMQRRQKQSSGVSDVKQFLKEDDKPPNEETNSPLVPPPPANPAEPTPPVELFTPIQFQTEGIGRKKRIPGPYRRWASHIYDTSGKRRFLNTTRNGTGDLDDAPADMINAMAGPADQFNVYPVPPVGLPTPSDHLHAGYGNMGPPNQFPAPIIPHLMSPGVSDYPMPFSGACTNQLGLPMSYPYAWPGALYPQNLNMTLPNYLSPSGPTPQPDFAPPPDFMAPPDFAAPLGYHQPQWPGYNTAPGAIFVHFPAPPANLTPSKPASGWAEPSSSLNGSAQTSPLPTNLAQTVSSSTNFAQTGSSSTNLAQPSPSPTNLANTGSSPINSAETGSSLTNSAKTVLPPANSAKTGSSFTKSVNNGLPSTNSARTVSSPTSSANTSLSSTSSATTNSARLNSPPTSSAPPNSADTGLSSTNSATTNSAQLNSPPTSSAPTNSVPTGLYPSNQGQTIVFSLKTPHSEPIFQPPVTPPLSDQSSKRKAGSELPIVTDLDPTGRGFEAPHINHLMAMHQRNLRQDSMWSSTLSKRVKAAQLEEKRRDPPPPLHSDNVSPLPSRIPPPVMPLPVRKKVKY